MHDTDTDAPAVYTLTFHAFQAAKSSIRLND